MNEATKADERLAQLRIIQIVNELGEDSYIATAMQGVWNIITRNIENDWAESVQEHLDAEEALETQIRLIEWEAQELREDKERLKSQVGALKEIIHRQERALGAIVEMAKEVNWNE